MKFIYPNPDGPFPFDPLAFKIVKKLEEIGWETPSICTDIRIEHYEGEEYRSVERIKHVCSEIFFCRRQEQPASSRYTEIASINRIVLPPDLEMNVYGSDLHYDHNKPGFQITPVATKALIKYCLYLKELLKIIVDEPKTSFA